MASLVHVESGQNQMSMANCYFDKPHGMQHCYIPFSMLLISNALLTLAWHRCGLHHRYDRAA